MARLIVREQGKEKVYEIKEDVITIGRVNENHIAIRDPRSSRKHCKIVRTPQGFKVFDLKSRNGIFLNGKPVEEEDLQSGDKIEIGDTVILFEGEAALAEEPSSAEWCLKVTAGPQKGKVFLLGRDPALIGRHKAADFSLEDEQVAIHHAQILPTEEGFLLADLNSKEGTFVNGKKIKKVLLKAEMIITLGKTHFRFCKTSSDAAPSPVTPSAPSPSRETKEHQESSSSLDEVEEITIGDDDSSDEEKPAEKPEKKRPSRRQPQKKADPDLEEEVLGMPSQADFEAINLEGIGETSTTVTVLVSLGVTLVSVFLLIVGIDFFARLLSPESPDPAKKGNLVKNWSFEETKEMVPENWKLTGGAVLDKEQFLGGKFSLMLNGKAGSVAEGQGEKVLVSSKKIYFLRYYIKMEGAGPSGVRVHWSNEDTGYSRKDYPLFQEGNSDWKEVTALLQPPRRANTLQVSFLTLGKSGTVWFDRIHLEERNTADSEYLAEAYVVEMEKNLSLQVDSRGLFSLKGSSPSTTYLYRGELQLFTSSPEGLSHQAMALITQNPQFKGSSLFVEGKIYHKETGKWYPFREEISKKEDHLEVSFEVSADDPLPLLSLAALKGSSLDLSLPSQKEKLSNKFQLPAVSEIALGEGASKAVFYFPEKASIKGLTEGKRSYLIFEWKNTGKVRFWITRTSKTEREEEARRTAQALAFSKQGQMEEAIKAWREIEKIFSYNPVLVQKAREKIQTFEGIQEAYLRELERIRQDIESLESPFLVESSRKKCETIVRSFPSFSSQASEILKRLDSLEAELKQKEHRRKARELLERANNILGQGLTSQDSQTLALAAAYYREILLHYKEDNLITREATHKLGLIHQRIQHSFEKLLKR